MSRIWQDTILDYSTEFKPSLYRPEERKLKGIKVVCGAKVLGVRKFHGAKVLVTFAHEERKFRGYVCESSMERKFLDFSLPRSECSTERKFHGIKSSLYGLFAPWNKNAEEWKCQILYVVHPVLAWCLWYTSEGLIPASITTTATFQHHTVCCSYAKLKGATDFRRRVLRWYFDDLKGK